MSYLDRFQSIAAAEKYLATYEAALALWAVATEPNDVTTRYGVTHINTAGSPDNPPLVLIHGAQTSSTVWYANIAALCRNFRIYALDVIDQSGKSLPAQKLQTRQDYSNWLCDVLDELNIDSASFVGHSHGGWQVLNLAILASQRMNRMILLSPAGITRLRWETFLSMFPVFIKPTRQRFYKAFQWSTVRRLDDRSPDPVIEQMVAGATCFKSGELGLGIAQTFREDELRKILHPALLLVGDQEKIFNPKDMIVRAQRLMPNLAAKSIPNAGHLLLIDQADLVNMHMINFLSNGS